MRSLRGSSLFALAVLGAVLLAAPLGGQNVELKSESDPNLGAIIAARNALQGYGTSPFNFPDRLTSPDSAALQALDQAANSGAIYLRATADLLGVYDNMQCARDRATMKPLLEDRLRLYSRLLDLDAQSASIPLTTPGFVKLGSTTKLALQLRDDLLAAKNRLDTVAASFE
ncbi:MAG TPA: hypothetical protein VNJ12_02055 [Candidatus Dormibacteraeota bacterium]|nr:hypothetical protein [Candidatus Dormibacteraeota bacterium]